MRSRRAMLFPGQLIGNRLLDNRPLEEARVVARVQHGGIGERELAKILFGDEALLNHLKRFGYHLAEIRHIKVRAHHEVKSLFSTLPREKTKVRRLLLVFPFRFFHPAQAVLNSTPQLLPRNRNRSILAIPARGNCINGTVIEAIELASAHP